ncbi:MAG: GGDEF domain-containing protein [Methylococcaceae bacterium]|nr:GGDEF domain-containing protein [Methylococcaceae bacterium]
MKIIKKLSLVKRIHLTFGVLLAALMYSFSPVSSTAALAAGSPLPVIDFQLRWHHQFQFAGYYAAVEQGYYREEGLDVRLHEAAPGRTPVEEVLAGRAQYGESNSELLYARLNGKPLVALAAIFQHSPSVLLARKDARVHSPHDLVGKKVMLLNAQTDADFHAMFLHEGIKPDAIDIEPSSLDIEDLLSGKVAAFDSYLTNEPYLLKQRGVDYTVISPSTYGIDFYSDILFTTEQEIKQHPERVEAFRRATLKGWRYAMGHSAEVIDLLITKYNVPKSRAHLQFEADAMRPLILPDLIEIGHMNPGRWQRMAESFTDVGMGNKNFSLEGFIYDPNPPHEVAKLKKTITVISAIGGASLLVTAGLFFGWARLKKEVELRKIAEAEVRYLAYNDSLTGIPNRNSFIPYASKLLLSAHRTGQKVALCYIDLNDFKEINDNHGHKAGDAALQHVAKAISSVIRESDMAARMGGDEFVVLLAGVHDVDGTRRTVDEIQQAIAQPILFKGHELVVTVSVGVAIYPEDGEQIDDLISKADTAMFRDKATMKVADIAQE